MRRRESSRWALVGSLAWRFLRGRRSRLLDGTARSALIATVIGVTAMVIAMALMTGYREDLQQKVIGGNAAIMAYPLSSEGFELPRETRDALATVPGLETWRRVTYGQGSLAGGAIPEGVDVTLRGAAEDELVPGTPQRVGAAFATVGGAPGVLAGSGVARRLGVAEGDVLRLMVLGVYDGAPRFAYRSVRLAGTFESGFSEFDEHLVVLDRALLESLAGRHVGSAAYEFVVGDVRRSAAVAEAVREALGIDFLIRDFRELNRELFTALRLQQIALFFVLGLIVLVSTFSVASSLVVLVRERMRDIGVLAALGLAPRHLRSVFLLFGASLAGFGVAGGVALGAGASWLLTRYELIRFDPEVAAIYFLSSVPFRVRPVDLAAVVGFTLIVTLAACWLPARRAARLVPARALRYE